jgi:hypothetical protein
VQGGGRAGYFFITPLSADSGHAGHEREHSPFVPACHMGLGGMVFEIIQKRSNLQVSVRLFAEQSQKIIFWLA